MSFSILPADAQTAPEDDLAAATAGALAIPTAPSPAPEDPAAPFGSTWQFDFEAGQFVRPGGSPAVTTGLGALEQWCLMAVHSTRYAHAVFTDDFGIEEPDKPLGELATGELLADWQRHLIEALLVHDRVSSVEDVDISWDASTGVITINSLDVVTDEDRLTIGPVQLQPGGAQ